MWKKQQGEGERQEKREGEPACHGLLFRKHAYLGIGDGFMSSRCCSL